MHTHATTTETTPTTEPGRARRRRSAARIVALGALLPILGAAGAAAPGAAAETAGAPPAGGADRAAGATNELAPKPTASASRAGRIWAPHVRRFIVPTHARSKGSQLATWYGPGLWGNRMGCGGRLTRSTWGIAHRTLPCGTLVGLTYGNRRVAVRVVDRGPYSGATVDLTRRTSDFLKFTSRGTGSVKMSVIRRYRH